MAVFDHIKTFLSEYKIGVYIVLGILGFWFIASRIWIWNICFEETRFDARETSRRVVSRKVERIIDAIKLKKVKMFIVRRAAYFWIPFALVLGLGLIAFIMTLITQVNPYGFFYRMASGFLHFLKTLGMPFVIFSAVLALTAWIGRISPYIPVSVYLFALSFWAINAGVNDGIQKTLLSLALLSLIPFVVLLIIWFLKRITYISIRLSKAAQYRRKFSFLLLRWKGNY